MISDPSQFLQRVLEEALARSTSIDEARVDQDAGDSEALLAQALGERLAGLFEAESQGTGETDQAWPENGIDPAFMAHYEELLHRNMMLARALGACDCWGEDAQCEVCMGQGAPGWCIPDSRLFSWFVRPAARSLRQSCGMPMRRPQSMANGSMRWP